MNQSIDPKALSKAIKTLGDEMTSFQITPETTIMSIFDQYVAHEEKKARERASSGMFLNGSQE